MSLPDAMSYNPTVIKCCIGIFNYRPSFEKVNLWTENLLFHFEHGVALPPDLRGDPVEFYHELRAKKKPNRRKSDSDSDITPEKSEGKTLERKSSTKGSNQSKNNLCTITEGSKGSVLDKSLDSNVPKQGDSDVNLTGAVDKSKDIPTISTHLDCDTSSSNIDNIDAHLNHSEAHSDSYQATESSSEEVQREKCSNQSSGS